MRGNRLEMRHCVLETTWNRATLYVNKQPIKEPGELILRGLSECSGLVDEDYEDPRRAVALKLAAMCNHKASRFVGSKRLLAKWSVPGSTVLTQIGFYEDAIQIMRNTGGV